MRYPLLLISAWLLFFATELLAPQSARSTTITIVNLDGSGEGFNDTSAPDPASTAGGNSGMPRGALVATLGGQRQIAAQFAADIWADLLSSNVPILIDAKFVPPNPNPPDPLIPADSLNRLNCDAARPVIATGDANTFHGAFKAAAGKDAPLKDTWYPQALANSIAGMDLNSFTSDIRVYFNSSVGTADCLPNNDWYYGLDGNPAAGQFDFVTIALREIARGLGFKTPANLATGAKLGGFNDVFLLNLKDISSGKLFSEMTDAERVVAGKNSGNLRWIGANVVAAHGGDMPMYAPPVIDPGFSVSNWDTSLQSGSVTIDAGSPMVLINITPVDDALVEGGETVILAPSANSAYNVDAPSNAAVTIADNDTPPPPTVTIEANLSDASETGPTAGQFTVTRTGATASPLTVNYRISGTAINGTDYSTISTSVTIPASSATATITVTPIDDVLVEATETVILTLRTNTAYTMGTPGKAMMTITDSDSAPLPAVSITANQPNASETGPTPGQFTVTRTGSVAADLAVTYAIGGAATNTTDYATLSGSVTILAGSATAPIPVSPVDDTVVEGSETVILTLTANTTYTVISPSSAIVTIADNDSTPILPTVSIAANLPDASETGPTAGQFILTRTGDTTLPLTVNYMIGGTATNGEDYEVLPTNVPIDSHPYELLEPFYIAAKHDVGLALQALEDIGWTLDPGGSVKIVALDAAVKEGAPTGFIVHRTGATDQPLTVFLTVSGTATSGTDYAPAITASVAVPAGVSSVNIDVTPIFDAVTKEKNETVIVTLQADTAAYTVGFPSTATVTILNNVPAFGTGTPPQAEIGVLYSFDLPVSGGKEPYQFPLQFAKGALPDGLTLSGLTIQGTPSSAAKTASFTIKVTDQQGVSVSKKYKITVLTAVNITTTSLKNGQINKAYKATLKVTGGAKTYNWTLDASTPLPSGLSLSANGVISGTPATGGVYSPTVRVTDALGGTFEKPLTLTIN